MNKNHLYLTRTDFGYSKEQVEFIETKYLPDPEFRVIAYKKPLKDAQGNFIHYKTDRKGKWKKGDIKYKTVYQLEDIYSNIYDCWEKNNKYLQASSGLAHNERNVVICDIDADNWNKGFFLNDLKELKPTHIVENPETHHLQIGWQYRKPLYHKLGASAIVHLSNIKYINKKVEELAKKYNLIKPNQKYGDPNYTGWRCKNPYNKKLKLIHLDLNNYWDFDINEEVEVEVNVDKAPSVEKLPIRNKIQKSNSDPSNSRNQYHYNQLRKALYRYCRSNGHRMPTIEEAYVISEKIAKEAGEITSKGMQTQAEICATTKCVFNYCERNYQANWIGEADGENKGIYQFMSAVKDANYFIQLLKFKITDEGLSTRKAAEVYNVSANTISKWRNKTTAEIIDKKRCLTEQLNRIKNHNFQSNQKYLKLQQQLQYYFDQYQSTVLLQNNQIINNNTTLFNSNIYYSRITVDNDNVDKKDLQLIKYVKSKNLLFDDYKTLKHNIEFRNEYRKIYVNSDFRFVDFVRLNKMIV